MDTFILAATSFIIAVSLLMTGRKEKLQMSFVGLCIAVFASQTGAFFRVIFPAAFWGKIEYLGILAVAPFALFFFRRLTRNKFILTKGFMVFSVLLSSLGAIFLFTPLARWLYFNPVVLSYVFATLGLCYIALVLYIDKLQPGVEKTRLGYLLFAFPTALVISSLDLLIYFGFRFPPISGIVLSVLLYFTLLILSLIHI